jgi:hypothetical protein
MQCGQKRGQAMSQELKLPYMVILPNPNHHRDSTNGRTLVRPILPGLWLSSRTASRLPAQGQSKPAPVRTTRGPPNPQPHVRTKRSSCPYHQRRPAPRPPQLICSTPFSRARFFSHAPRQLASIRPPATVSLHIIPRPRRLTVFVCQGVCVNPPLHPAPPRPTHLTMPANHCSCITMSSSNNTLAAR